jgi:hypothetical protein
VRPGPVYRRTCATKRAHLGRAGWRKAPPSPAGPERDALTITYPGRRPEVA